MSGHLHHKPPPGTLYRHVKTDSLYRVLFHASARPTAPVDFTWIFNALVSTNDDERPYREVGVFDNKSDGLFTDLPYNSVIYISQTTLCIYARRTQEFHGYVGSRRRFELEKEKP